MAQIINVTRYKNQYAIIIIYSNVIFMVKFLIAKIIFKKILSCDLGDNNKTFNEDLF